MLNIWHRWEGGRLAWLLGGGRCRLRRTGSSHDWMSPGSTEAGRHPSFRPTAHTPTQGFLGGSVVKNLPANVGDEGLIPGLGMSPGEGNGNSLQFPQTDRAAWWATVRGVTNRHD